MPDAWPVGWGGLSNIVGSVFQGENEQEVATLKILNTAPNCLQV